MQLDIFRLFSPEMQLRHVLARGIYLAQSWRSEGGVKLYYCANEGRGFFVEVGVDAGKEQATVVRTFTDSGPLAEYAQGVQLPAV